MMLFVPMPMASQKIETIAKRNNSTIQWIPVLLGGIYKSLQSEQMPSSSWAPSKAQLGLRDLEREARIQRFLSINPNHTHNVL